MSTTRRKLVSFGAALALTSVAIAADDPIQARQAHMENVGKAAKPIGLMFRGESDYDAATVMKSLETWQKVGIKFGNLFPEGSETGQDTEAAPAIWEDRDGFDRALAEWSEATAAAIAANPQSLEEARPTVGPVFNACKNCHDSYRIEDE